MSSMSLRLRTIELKIHCNHDQKVIVRNGPEAFTNFHYVLILIIASEVTTLSIIRPVSIDLHLFQKRLSDKMESGEWQLYDRKELWVSINSQISH